MAGQQVAVAVDQPSLAGPERKHIRLRIKAIPALDRAEVVPLSAYSTTSWLPEPRTGCPHTASSYMTSSPWLDRGQHCSATGVCLELSFILEWRILSRRAHAAFPVGAPVNRSERRARGWPGQHRPISETSRLARFVPYPGPGQRGGPVEAGRISRGGVRGARRVTSPCRASPADYR